MVRFRPAGPFFIQALSKGLKKLQRRWKLRIFCLQFCERYFSGKSLQPSTLTIFTVLFQFIEIFLSRSSNSFPRLEQRIQIEESPITWKVWLRQRTRWQQEKIQTLKKMHDKKFPENLCDIYGMQYTASRSYKP